MVNQSFLVTTALESTWPKAHDTPVLFLGEWCRLYHRKHVWEQMPYVVLPYHWDDREKCYTDYHYLCNLTEKWLLLIADKLNVIHNVQHTVRYWRIVVGPWLGYFLQILLDRWLSIQAALSHVEPVKTSFLDVPVDAMIPTDMQAFSELLSTDIWNHCIYREILKDAGVVGETRAHHAEVTEHSASRLSRVRRASYWLNDKLIHALPKKDKFFLFSTYLPSFSEIKLQCTLHQLPKKYRTVDTVRSVIDLTCRQWDFTHEFSSRFEQLAHKLIPLCMPSVYLEGYQLQVNNIKTMPWPKNPDVIWTANRHITDDVFKCWAAEKIEQGSTFVIGQYGGHFGMGQWSFLEAHDLAVCDRYLSWGWQDSDSLKITPSVYHKGTKKKGDSSSRLLIVGTTVPRYSYHMYSIMIAGQWLDYFNDQVRFVQCLKQMIQEQVTVRLCKTDSGWDQYERWRDQCINLDIDAEDIKMPLLLGDCRLYVGTYNATAYLEAFALDIPTVIFWNPAHWELRDTAIPYFKLLKEAKIFHETPESAADHINTIWNDITGWWFSSEVREALTVFKQQYLRIDTHPLKVIKTVLKVASQ